MAQVWNCLLAPYTLAEVLTVQRLVASIVIIGGTVAAALFGPTRDTSTRGELLGLLTTGEAIGYYVAFAVWQCFAAFMTFLGPPHLRGPFLGSLAGAFGGVMFFQTVAVDLSYDCIFGTAEKCDAIGGPGYQPELDPFFWCMTLFAILFGYFAALGLLAYGLRTFEALFMVTIYETALIISGNLCGLLVLGEIKSMNAGSIAGYVLANFVVVSGLFILQRWPSSCLDPERAIPMPYAERCQHVAAKADAPSPNEASELLQQKEQGSAGKS